MHNQTYAKSRQNGGGSAGELDAAATVLRFYYVDSPPPLTVGLFFIHNHADGTYSGAHCTPCEGAHNPRAHLPGGRARQFALVGKLRLCVQLRWCLWTSLLIMENLWD